MIIKNLNTNSLKLNKYYSLKLKLKIFECNEVLLRSKDFREE